MVSQLKVVNRTLCYMLIFLFVVFAAGCGLGGGDGDGDGTPLPTTETPPTTGGGALTKNLGGFVLQAVQGANLKPQAGADVIVNGEKKGKTDSAGRIVDLNGEPGIVAPAEGNVLVEVQSDKATSFQQIVNLLGSSKANVTGVTQAADPENAGTLSKSGLAKPGVKLFGVAADTEFTTSNSQQLAGPPDLRKAANVILKQFDDWKRGFNIKVTPYQSAQNPGHAFPNTLTEETTTYKLEVVSGAKVELRWSSSPNQNQLVNNRAEFDELGFHLDTSLSSPHTHAATPGQVIPRSANQMGGKDFTAVATWICVSRGGSFDAGAGTCSESPAPSPGARLGLWYLDLDPDKPNASDKRWIRMGEAEIAAGVIFRDQSGALLITHPKVYRPKTNVVIPKPVPFVFVLEDPDSIQGTLSGKVTDAATGAGLPGALVTVKNSDGQAVTDTQGNYSLTLTIELTGPQKLVAAKKLDGGEGAGYQDATATVTFSQVSSSVVKNFALNAIPTTATVAGKVAKLDGTAAAGATVILKSPIVLDTITYTSGTINFDDVVVAVTGLNPGLTLSYSHQRATVTVGSDPGATYKWEVSSGPSGLTYPFTIKSGLGANTLTQVEILAEILKKLLCTIQFGVCVPTGPAVTNPSIEFLGQYDLKVTVTHQGGVIETAQGSIRLLNNILAPTSSANVNQLNVLNISGDMVRDRCLFATAVQFDSIADSNTNPDRDKLRTGVTYTWKMDVTFQGSGTSSTVIAPDLALSSSRLLLYNEVERAVLENFAPLVATDSNCNNKPRILCGVNVVVKVVDSGCTGANCAATSTFGMQLGSIPDLLQRIQIGDIEFQQNPQPVFAEISVETDSNGNYAIVKLDPAIYNSLNPAVQATLANFNPSAATQVGTLTAGQTNTVNLELGAQLKVALPERSPRLPRPV